MQLASLAEGRREGGREIRKKRIMRKGGRETKKGGRKMRKEEGEEVNSKLLDTDWNPKFWVIQQIDGIVIFSILQI